MTLNQQGIVMMPQEGDVLTVAGDTVTFKALGFYLQLNAIARSCRSG